MKQNVKNMRKQIIDFADSVVNPKDDGCVRSKRLTDKDSQMMMFLEYVQTESKIDEAYNNREKSDLVRNSRKRRERNS